MCFIWRTGANEQLSENYLVGAHPVDWFECNASMRRCFALFVHIHARNYHFGRGVSMIVQQVGSLCFSSSYAITSSLIHLRCIPLNFFSTNDTDAQLMILVYTERQHNESDLISYPLVRFLLSSSRDKLQMKLIRTSTFTSRSPLLFFVSLSVPQTAESRRWDPPDRQ